MLARAQEKNYSLKEKLESNLNEEVQLNIIKLLVKLIKLKDPDTAVHSERVKDIAVNFAKYLNLTKEQIRTLAYAAMLHDIGKIGLSESILSKKGTLTKEELNKVKMHPIMGFEAIRDINFLNDSLDVILHHHEKVDGTGYPDGIKSEDISILCKIVCLADAFDVMTNGRCYKRSMDIGEIICELEENRGTQFDELLTDIFIKFIKETYRIQGSECS